jgi:hypothetical protein
MATPSKEITPKANAVRPTLEQASQLRQLSRHLRAESKALTIKNALTTQAANEAASRYCDLCDQLFNASFASHNAADQ